MISYETKNKVVESNGIKQARAKARKKVTSQYPMTKKTCMKYQIQ